MGGGVRVDVKAMLWVGGDVGYGRCEPRIEGIVQCTKKVLYNIKRKYNYLIPTFPINETSHT